MELLTGILLPPVIDLLNKDVPNPVERFIVACFVCLLVAIGVDWNQVINGDVHNLAPIATLLFAESQTVFRLYWEESFLREKLQNHLQGSKTE